MAGTPRYTQEQIWWILNESIMRKTKRRLIQAGFERRFGRDLLTNQLRYVRQKYGVIPDYATPLKTGNLKLNAEYVRGPIKTYPPASPREVELLAAGGHLVEPDGYEWPVNLDEPTERQGPAGNTQSSGSQPQFDSVPSTEMAAANPTTHDQQCRPQQPSALQQPNALTYSTNDGQGSVIGRVRREMAQQAQATAAAHGQHTNPVQDCNPMAPQYWPQGLLPAPTQPPQLPLVMQETAQGVPFYFDGGMPGQQAAAAVYHEPVQAPMPTAFHPTAPAVAWPRMEETPAWTEGVMAPAWQNTTQWWDPSVLELFGVGIPNDTNVEPRRRDGSEGNPEQEAAVASPPADSDGGETAPANGGGYSCDAPLPSIEDDGGFLGFAQQDEPREDEDFSSLLALQEATTRDDEEAGNEVSNVVDPSTRDVPLFTDAELTEEEFERAMEQLTAVGFDFGAESTQ